jgi:bacillithiol synthase
MFIPFRQFAGYRSLFVDYCDSFGKVSDFYRYNPNQQESYASRLTTLQNQTNESHPGIGLNKNADRIVRTETHRNIVTDVLIEQNRLYGATDATLANIELLRRANTAVVVTGQQAGLFGGPMYTLVKAAHTIRLARKLQKDYPDWNILPLFWIAADDHDFEEVRRFGWVGLDNEEHACEFSPLNDYKNKPVGSVIVDESIVQPVECFFSTNPPTEFTAELRLIVESAYASGNTMADAFGILMTRLLGKQGLILVNPFDSRLKRLGAPIFAQAIEKRSEVFDGIYRQNDRLDKLNYHKQIGLPADGTNLFIIDKGRRDALRMNGSLFSTEAGLSLPLPELAKVIAEEPERISPNVVLRPVYQDVLFPVVASIVGPSELAYYAQISGVFGNFNLEPPVYVPRLSLTIIEHRISKILEETGLAWWECGEDKDELITRVVRSKLPENMYSDIEKFKHEINGLTTVFAGKIVDFEPEIKVILDKMSQGIANYADTIEKKVRQAYKQKNKIWVDRIVRAANMLFPARGFQERYFGVIYFVNKFGIGIIDRIVDELSPDEIGHHWLVE